MKGTGYAAICYSAAKLIVTLWYLVLGFLSPSAEKIEEIDLTAVVRPYVSGSVLQGTVFITSLCCAAPTSRSSPVEIEAPSSFTERSLPVREQARILPDSRPLRYSLHSSAIRIIQFMLAAGHARSLVCKELACFPRVSDIRKSVAEDCVTIDEKPSYPRDHLPDVAPRMSLVGARFWQRYSSKDSKFSVPFAEAPTSALGFMEHPRFRATGLWFRTGPHVQSARPETRAPGKIYRQLSCTVYKRRVGSLTRLVNGRPILDLDRTQVPPSGDGERLARQKYSWQSFTSIATTSKTFGGPSRWRARWRAKIKSAVLKPISGCLLESKELEM